MLTIFLTSFVFSCKGALPDILEAVPSSFQINVMRVIGENAALSFDKISNTPGLRPVMPSGAMYMLVGIDIALFPHFKDDTQV